MYSQAFCPLQVPSANGPAQATAKPSLSVLPEHTKAPSETSVVRAATYALWEQLYSASSTSLSVERLMYLRVAPLGERSGTAAATERKPELCDGDMQTSRAKELQSAGAQPPVLNGVVGSVLTSAAAAAAAAAASPPPWVEALFSPVAPVSKSSIACRVPATMPCPTPSRVPVDASSSPHPCPASAKDGTEANAEDCAPQLVLHAEEEEEAAKALVERVSAHRTGTPSRATSQAEVDATPRALCQNEETHFQEARRGSTGFPSAPLPPAMLEISTTESTSKIVSVSADTASAIVSVREELECSRIVDVNASGEEEHDEIEADTMGSQRDSTALQARDSVATRLQSYERRRQAAATAAATAKTATTTTTEITTSAAPLQSSCAMSFLSDEMPPAPTYDVTSPTPLPSSSAEVGGDRAPSPASVFDSAASTLWVDEGLMGTVEVQSNPSGRDDENVVAHATPDLAAAEVGTKTAEDEQPVCGETATENVDGKELRDEENERFKTALSTPRPPTPTRELEEVDDSRAATRRAETAPLSPSSLATPACAAVCNDDVEPTLPMLYEENKNEEEQQQTHVSEDEDVDIGLVSLRTSPVTADRERKARTAAAQQTQHTPSPQPVRLSGASPGPVVRLTDTMTAIAYNSTTMAGSDTPALSLSASPLADRDGLVFSPPRQRQRQQRRQRRRRREPSDEDSTSSYSITTTPQLRQQQHQEHQQHQRQVFLPSLSRSASATPVPLHDRQTREAGENGTIFEDVAEMHADASTGEEVAGGQEGCPKIGNEPVQEDTDEQPRELNASFAAASASSLSNEKQSPLAEVLIVGSNVDAEAGETDAVLVGAVEPDTVALNDKGEEASYTAERVSTPAEVPSSLTRENVDASAAETAPLSMQQRVQEESARVVDDADDAVTEDTPATDAAPAVSFTAASLLPMDLRSPDQRSVGSYSFSSAGASAGGAGGLGSSCTPADVRYTAAARPMALEDDDGDRGRAFDHHTVTEVGHNSSVERDADASADARPSADSLSPAPRRTSAISATSPSSTSLARHVVSPARRSISTMDFAWAAEADTALRQQQQRLYSNSLAKSAGAVLSISGGDGRSPTYASLSPANANSKLATAPVGPQAYHPLPDGAIGLRGPASAREASFSNREVSLGGSPSWSVSPQPQDPRVRFCAGAASVMPCPNAGAQSQSGVHDRRAIAATVNAASENLLHRGDGGANNVFASPMRVASSAPATPPPPARLQTHRYEKQQRRVLSVSPPASSSQKKLNSAHFAGVKRPRTAVAATSTAVLVTPRKDGGGQGAQVEASAGVSTTGHDVHQYSKEALVASAKELSPSPQAQEVPPANMKDSDGVLRKKPTRRERRAAKGASAKNSNNSNLHSREMPRGVPSATTAAATVGGAATMRRCRARQNALSATHLSSSAAATAAAVANEFMLPRTASLEPAPSVARAASPPPPLQLRTRADCNLHNSLRSLPTTGCAAATVSGKGAGSSSTPATSSQRKQKAKKAGPVSGDSTSAHMTKNVARPRKLSIVALNQKLQMSKHSGKEN